MDPATIADAFPENWQRFLAETFHANVPLIMQVFGVSERCVRKWLKGEGGVRARQTIIAQVQAPDQFAAIILGRAA